MSANEYPMPPPSYGATPKGRNNGDDARDPLLGGASSSRGGGAYFDQVEAGDVPDDFKYGVTVSESSPEIRNAFVRKVYTILFCQILGTCIVGGLISQSSSALIWVQNNIWSFYTSAFGTLIVLGFLYWKRHSHPWNFALLGLFTLMEAFTLGVVVAFYENVLVLQALLITLGVFLGLTLFTFQSKYEFDGMAPFLFGGLMALVFTGFIGVFWPFSSTVELVYAIGGCLVFSGYIVYDTYVINKKLSPDEFIMGSVSLYLDFINLFINILRLLNNVNER